MTQEKNGYRKNRKGVEEKVQENVREVLQEKSYNN